MKHAILLVSICLAFLLAGCGEKVDNLKQNVDEKVSVITGKETVSDEEKAKEVAKKFAKEFLTISDKTPDDYIGGTEYLHPEFRETFVSTMKEKFPTYDEMVEMAGGKEHLPEVVSAKIENFEEQDFEFDGAKYKSYRMDVVVTYKNHGEDGFDFDRITLNVTYYNNTWVITSIEI